MMVQSEIRTRSDIEERFKAAALTERRRHVEGAGPAKPKGSMPAYVHDWADKNGWGSERLKEERADFFKALERGITPQDITAMEQCERWTAELVDNPKHRRALWAWAASKVGGLKFKVWCERERTNVKTAREWKNAAITRIYGEIVRNASQRQVSGENGGFTDSPVSPYVSATFENHVQTARPLHWRDDLSLEPIFDEPRFRYARQREAKPQHMPETHEAVKAKRAA